MAYNENSYKAAKKYKADNIKRVPLDMQIELYNEIKEAAATEGESVNGYIKKAVIQRMERSNNITPAGNFHIVEKNTSDNG